MGLWESEWKKQFNWFKDCEGLEEGQRLYRALLLQHHPDQGGTQETCQGIILEFQKFVKLMVNRAFQKERFGKEGEATDEKTDESQKFSADFYEVLEQVMEMNLDVELIGTWVWVKGATLFTPLALEQLGFHWSPKHKAYFWNGLTWDEIQAITKKYKNIYHPAMDWSLDDMRDYWGTEQKREKMYLGGKDDKDAH